MQAYHTHGVCVSRRSILTLLALQLPLFFYGALNRSPEREGVCLTLVAEGIPVTLQETNLNKTC